MINSFKKSGVRHSLTMYKTILEIGGLMAGRIDKNLVYQKASSIVEAEGCKLIEVEVKNNGGKIILGLVIDKSGGVKIEDCEKISQIVDPILDEAEGVAGKYDFFTVSSAGLDRPFKTTEDFKTHVGEKIEVKLYSAVNKTKFITAELKEADDEYILLGDDIKILRSNIQKANIAIEF